MKGGQGKTDIFWRIDLPGLKGWVIVPAFLEEYCAKSTAFVHHLCESGEFRFAMDRTLRDIRECAVPS